MSHYLYSPFPPHYRSLSSTRPESEAPLNTSTLSEPPAPRTSQERPDTTSNTPQERVASSNPASPTNTVNSSERRNSATRFRSFIPRLKKVRDDTSWLRDSPSPGKSSDGEVRREKVVARFQPAEGRRAKRKRRSLIPQPVKQASLTLEDEGQDEDEGEGVRRGGTEDETKQMMQNFLVLEGISFEDIAHSPTVSSASKSASASSTTPLPASASVPAPAVPETPTTALYSQKTLPDLPFTQSPTSITPRPTRPTYLARRPSHPDDPFATQLSCEYGTGAWLSRKSSNATARPASLKEVVGGDERQESHKEEGKESEETKRGEVGFVKGKVREGKEAAMELIKYDSQLQDLKEGQIGFVEENWQEQELDEIKLIVENEQDEGLHDWESLEAWNPELQPRILAGWMGHGECRRWNGVEDSSYGLPRARGTDQEDEIGEEERQREEEYAKRVAQACEEEEYDQSTTKAGFKNLVDFALQLEDKQRSRSLPSRFRLRRRKALPDIQRKSEERTNRASQDGHSKEEKNAQKISTNAEPSSSSSRYRLNQLQKLASPFSSERNSEEKDEDEDESKLQIPAKRTFKRSSLSRFMTSQHSLSTVPGSPGTPNTAVRFDEINALPLIERVRHASYSKSHSSIPTPVTPKTPSTPKTAGSSLELTALPPIERIHHHSFTPPINVTKAEGGQGYDEPKSRWSDDSSIEEAKKKIKRKFRPTSKDSDLVTEKKSPTHAKKKKSSVSIRQMASSAKSLPRKVASIATLRKKSSMSMSTSGTARTPTPHGDTHHHRHQHQSRGLSSHSSPTLNDEFRSTSPLPPDPPLPNPMNPLVNVTSPQQASSSVNLNHNLNNNGSSQHQHQLSDLPCYLHRLIPHLDADSHEGTLARYHIRGEYPRPIADDPYTLTLNPGPSTGTGIGIGTAIGNPHSRPSTRQTVRDSARELRSESRVSSRSRFSRGLRKLGSTSSGGSSQSTGQVKRPSVESETSAKSGMSTGSVGNAPLPPGVVVTRATGRKSAGTNGMGKERSSGQDASNSSTGSGSAARLATIGRRQPESAFNRWIMEEGMKTKKAEEGEEETETETEEETEVKRSGSTPHTHQNQLELELELERDIPTPVAACTIPVAPPIPRRSSRRSQPNFKSRGAEESSNLTKPSSRLQPYRHQERFSPSSGSLTDDSAEAALTPKPSRCLSKRLMPPRSSSLIPISTAPATPAPASGPLIRQTRSSAMRAALSAQHRAASISNSVSGSSQATSLASSSQHTSGEKSPILVVKFGPATASAAPVAPADPDPFLPRLQALVRRVEVLARRAREERDEVVREVLGGVLEEVVRELGRCWGGYRAWVAGTEGLERMVGNLEGGVGL